MDLRMHEELGSVWDAVAADEDIRVEPRRPPTLPSVRIGRCRRIPVEGLRAYIAGLETQTYLPGSIRRGA